MAGFNLGSYLVGNFAQRALIVLILFSIYWPFFLWLNFKKNKNSLKLILSILPAAGSFLFFLYFLVPLVATIIGDKNFYGQELPIALIFGLIVSNLVLSVGFFRRRKRVVI